MVVLVLVTMANREKGRELLLLIKRTLALPLSLIRKH